jgi:hypothetical protein
LGRLRGWGRGVFRCESVRQRDPHFFAGGDRTICDIQEKEKPRNKGDKANAARNLDHSRGNSTARTAATTSSHSAFSVMGFTRQPWRHPVGWRDWGAPLQGSAIDCKLQLLTVLSSRQHVISEA